MRVKSEREKFFDARVGYQIACLRKAAGMSRVALAEKLGIKYITLRNYERGSATISLYLLLRTACIVKASLAELVAPATRMG